MVAKKAKRAKKKKAAKKKSKRKPQRGFHGSNAAGQCPPIRSGREQTHSSNRGHKKTLGLYQEKQTAGFEKQTDDQRRRKPEARIRRPESGQHVRDDEAGQQKVEEGINSHMLAASLAAGDRRYKKLWGVANGGRWHVFEEIAAEAWYVA